MGLRLEMRENTSIDKDLLALRCMDIWQRLRTLVSHGTSLRASDLDKDMNG